VSTHTHTHTSTQSKLTFATDAIKFSDATLRFNVGDKVQAKVGKWVDGIVIMQWDEGNAYRIELEVCDKTNVWGPVDSDDYVRARPSGARPTTSGLVDERELNEAFDKLMFARLLARRRW
jgi:hypothetical protein